MTDEDCRRGYHELVAAERPIFEAIVQGLSSQQTALASALSNEPSRSIFSIDYMKRHGLSSTDGMQGALKKLSLLE